MDSSTTLRRQASPQARLLAIGAGLAALAALVAGLVGNAMLIDEAAGYFGEAMQCGLRVCERCVAANECDLITTISIVDRLQEAELEASSAWGWSGTIAWYAAIVACAGLVLGIVLVAIRKFVRLPIAPTTIILLGSMVALIGGCVFVATKPPSVDATGVGWTFWAFGGGVIAAILAAILLSRQLGLLQPEFDPGDSMPGSPDVPWDEV